jgi:diguanylate cyclase (GGDEF)-like protein
VEPSLHYLKSPTAGAEHQPEMCTELDAARGSYWEDPAGSLATAIRIAGRTGDEVLRARALALQGAISLHRGNLQHAFGLATEAEPLAGADATARCEVAALKAHLSFFSGSYAEALQHAEAAIAHADGAGDLDLRVFARRAACMVFGNVGVSDWYGKLHEVLDLSIAAGDRWQEAISRNDLACWHQQEGRTAEAESEIERGLAVARDLELNRFALGVLHSTRSDIRLLAGRPSEALADAEHAIAALIEQGEPNPYVFGVTVRAEVHALAALGRLDDAHRSGEGALARLGDHVPQARSLVLATIAEALKEAGRLEEAYDALSRSAELERQAMRELSELRISLDWATLEAEQAREQADRDWLTGLHNRRYLARRLDDIEARFSLAVLDLDHFKRVNDEHGHDVGDQVLIRVAGLLLGVVRHSDVVVRTGGEEFVLLMPMTDRDAALQCCERALQAIREADWSAVAPGLTVTASVGVACADEGHDLPALADRRLYDAKRAGRDRVA